MSKYISKYLELKLVNKASYSKEIEGRIVVVSGSSIRFKDGVYETTDPDEIKFLENHPNYGSVFIKVGKGDAAQQRKEMTKDLETKEREKAQKEAAGKKQKKALAEGEGLPKTKTAKGGAKAKKEKPAF
jgi:hypothetical protein